MLPALVSPRGAAHAHDIPRVPPAPQSTDEDRGLSDRDPHPLSPCCQGFLRGRPDRSPDRSRGSSGESGSDATTASPDASGHGPTGGPFHRPRAERRAHTPCDPDSRHRSDAAHPADTSRGSYTSNRTDTPDDADAEDHAHARRASHRGACPDTDGRPDDHHAPVTGGAQGLATGAYTRAATAPERIAHAFAAPMSEPSR
jgi:hypothetical protein